MQTEQNIQSEDINTENQPANHQQAEPADQTVEKTDNPQEHKKESKPKKSKKAQDPEVEKLKEELAKHKDMLLRTAAEFDNYKKRTERDRLKVAQFAKADVLKKLLPVIDNAKLAAASDQSSPEYIKGIDMMVRQFLGIVETFELVELAKVGDKFDPQYHEAISHVEDENAGENEIVGVVQQGYKLGDIVIRTALVQVAN